MGLANGAGEELEAAIISVVTVNYPIDILFYV